MAIVSKKIFFEVLDDIVDNYNNTYHRTIKMKPIDVRSDSYVKYMILMQNILNFKLVVMLEFQNTKTFFLKNILKIGQKNFL